jgi:hypothetical protein
MIKKISKNEAEEILNKSLKALGLSKDMRTNPLVMKKIIKEMNLSDFESSTTLFDLKEIQLKQKSFKLLFTDIKKSLISNHPAIIEFLQLSLKRGWLKKSEVVIKSIHVLYILEYLTSATCNDDTFLDEIHTHIKLKEKEYGIDLNHPIKALFNLFHLSHTFFGSVKTLTIDPMMIHLNPKFRDFKLSKDELKNFFKKHKLNYLEYRLLSRENKIKSFLDLGRINIYEAGITDYDAGYKLNTLCSEALSEELKDMNINVKYKKMLIIPENTRNPFYKQLSKNYSIDFPVTNKWQSLYITWNMAFILGNLDNLDILFPKLLIPSVLSVRSNQFIEPRVISLWFSINNVIFRLEQGKNLPAPKNRTEMAQEWGKINKKYAIELVNRDLHENEEKFQQSYHRFFDHRTRNFFKILKTFC